MQKETAGMKQKVIFAPVRMYDHKSSVPEIGAELFLFPIPFISNVRRTFHLSAKKTSAYMKSLTIPYKGGMILLFPALLLISPPFQPDVYQHPNNPPAHFPP